MGKQSKSPTLLSQEEYDLKLDASLTKLIDQGFSDEDIMLYAEDFKATYTVKKKRGISIYFRRSKIGFGARSGSWFFGFTAG